MIEDSVDKRRWRDTVNTSEGQSVLEETPIENVLYAPSP